MAYILSSERLLRAVLDTFVKGRGKDEIEP